METKMWLHDNVQTVKDLKVFTVFQLRWLKTKREMNGFKLSNEKIQTKSTPKSSDRICSLHFVDGIPTKANPLPTMKILKNIKIFIKSNQFLVNILLHNVIKTCSVSDFTMGCPYQARNQGFFRAGEVSENKGTSINI